VSTYRVEFTEPAEMELDAAYLNRSRFTPPEQAVRWHRELKTAITGLSEWPRRFQVLEGGGYSGEVRRMLFGRGSGAYHVIYRVLDPADDETEGIVRVLHVVSAVRQSPGARRETDDE